MGSVAHTGTTSNFLCIPSLEPKRNAELTSIKTNVTAHLDTSVYQTKMMECSVKINAESKSGLLKVQRTIMKNKYHALHRFGHAMKHNMTLINLKFYLREFGVGNTQHFRSVPFYNVIQVLDFNESQPISIKCVKKLH